MINTLRLQNFKGIRDVEVGLERLTVFVGSNASGKTSILQGLDFLVNGYELSLSYTQEYLFLVHDYFRRDLIHHGMELSASTNVGSVRILITAPNLVSTMISEVSPTQMEWASKFESKANDSVADWVESDQLLEVLTSLGHAQYFRFDAGLMAKPSSEVAYRLALDGRWLASTLTQMADKQPENFSSVEKSLTEFIPGITGIRLTKIAQQKDFMRLDGKPKDIIEFDLKNGSRIPARSASEGTLFVLGLLTILMNQNRPNVILLDDLDRGLHPLAQRDVIGLLRKVLEQQPDLQILATTHSPYLVDSLRPEEVRMTTLNDDGTVACGNLVDHPKFDRWKNEMSPGELWSMFGEKWVSQKSEHVETL